VPAKSARREWLRGAKIRPSRPPVVVRPWPPPRPPFLRAAPGAMSRKEDCRRRYIGIAVSLGLLLVVSPPQTRAQGQGAAPIQIVAPLPVPVTDSTNPADHPFQALLCSPGCQVGGPEPDPTTFVLVPAGTRLVIEYISGFCASPVDVTITFLH